MKFNASPDFSGRCQVIPFSEGLLTGRESSPFSFQAFPDDDSFQGLLE